MHLAIFENDKKAKKKLIEKKDTIQELTEDDSVVFLVYAAYDMDMRQLMKKTVTGTRYDEENITVLIYNCILSLHYLHKNGIVHRNLKPGNLLITD